MFDYTGWKATVRKDATSDRPYIVTLTHPEKGRAQWSTAYYPSKRKIKHLIRRSMSEMETDGDIMEYEF